MPAATNDTVAYKLNGQNVCKYTVNGSYQKVYALQSSIFMAKLVQISPTKVFLIGGATDVKGTNPVNNCKMLDLSVNPLRPEEKVKMITSRISFGACVSQDRKSIYVCGGFASQNALLKECEYYDVANNVWRALPDLNNAKCSMGLCEFIKNKDAIWLYSFGGITKENPKLLTEIERLSVGDSSSPGWETLSFKLPNPSCDVGCFQYASNKIMVIGGWNKVSFC